MVKGTKSAIVTVVGIIALATVVIVAMFQGVDGALYFWVVAGIVWIMRGNLPDIDIWRKRE